MAEDRSFALITGSSAGLGLAMAAELARRKKPLLLVALPGPELEEAAVRLKGRFGVDVRSLGIDLREADAPQRVVDWALAQGSVDLLINNAGVGGTRAFLSAPVPYIDGIILLNVRALALLTRLFLPHLEARSVSFILNVSSVAAFSPMPYKNVYPAAKAFIASLSRALREELRGSGVSVSVLHPGPLATNARVRAQMAQHGRLGRALNLSVEKTAARAIEGLLARRAVIVPGLMTKLNHLYFRVVPFRLRARMLARIFRKEDEGRGGAA